MWVILIIIAVVVYFKVKEASEFEAMRRESDYCANNGIKHDTNKTIDAMCQNLTPSQHRRGYAIEKALLNINEFCEYLGVGKTKAREILKAPRNGFALKIGSKWFVSRDALDKWITEQCQKY